jgi:hypothetical protein
VCARGPDLRSAAAEWATSWKRYVRIVPEMSAIQLDITVAPTTLGSCGGFLTDAARLAELKVTQQSDRPRRREEVLSRQRRVLAARALHERDDADRRDPGDVRGVASTTASGLPTSRLMQPPEAGLYSTPEPSARRRLFVLCALYLVQLEISPFRRVFVLP